MRDQDKHQEVHDAIWQGAHTRAIGRPKDACLYPVGSIERRAWLEGYDGRPCDEPASRLKTKS